MNIRITSNPHHYDHDHHNHPNNTIMFVPKNHLDHRNPARLLLETDGAFHLQTVVEFTFSFKFVSIFLLLLFYFYLKCIFFFLAIYRLWFSFHAT